MEFQYYKFNEGGDDEDDESGEEGVREKVIEESEQEGCFYEGVYFICCF